MLASASVCSHLHCQLHGSCNGSNMGSDGFVDELAATQRVEESARKYRRSLQAAATNRQGLVDTMAENQHRLIEPAEAYHAHTLEKGRGRGRGRSGRRGRKGGGQLRIGDVDDPSSAVVAPSPVPVHTPPADEGDKGPKALSPKSSTAERAEEEKGPKKRSAEELIPWTRCIPCTRCMGVNCRTTLGVACVRRTK